MNTRNIILFLLLTIYSLIFAIDENINFIKSYIENEQRPTDLLYSDLCWKKNIQVKLMNELVQMGVRTSSVVGLPGKWYQHSALILIDLNCCGSEEFFMNVEPSKATIRNLFASPFRWLILSNKNMVVTKRLLLDRPVLPDSDLVVAVKTTYGFELTEYNTVQKLISLVHKPAVNLSLISTPRGFYNGTLIDLRPHRQLFRRRKDLMGHHITISNVIQDSNTSKYHLVQEDRMELQYDAVAKICFIAAKHAFEMLNVTRRHIFSYRFGYKIKGKWSGMIHDLQLNKADMGTNCVVFIDRLEVVTYTDTVAPMRMRFIFRQPPLSYVSNIFSLPFSKNVWVAIVVCSLACTATLYFTSQWERKVEKTSTQLDGSIGDALLLTVSAVTQQGCFIEPRRTPGRIMEWVWFAALMALYAAYAANIVVLLQAPSHSIRTLAQLASSGIDVAANDLDYNRFVLSPSQTLTDPIHQKIHDRIRPEDKNGKYYNIYEGVEKIREGFFAFHSIVEPVYHRVEETFLETEKCDLTEVDFINSFDAATPVRRDSPYLELLKVVYKQLRESGLLSALNRRLQTPKPRCSNKQAAFSSVGILDLLPVMLLMLYGAALSLGIMIIEIAFFKLKQIYREKKKLFW